MACAGTNTQKLIDLLENMFGNLDEPDLEGLETDAMKSMHEQAAIAEKTDIEAMEGPIPTGVVTHVVHLVPHNSKF